MTSANRPEEVPIKNISPQRRGSLLRTMAGILLFLAIAGAAAALRFVLLDKSMWVDEATTYVIAGQKDVKGVMALASSQYTAHPPLYYLLVHYWFGKTGGPGLVSMRALSALFGLLWVLAMYPLGAALFRRKSGGFVAMALTALSPFAVYISQIGRMYSLLTLLTVVSCWLFVKLTGDRKPWWAWVLWPLVSLALIYTQYYGAAIIAFQTLYVLMRRRELGNGFFWGWVAMLVVVAAGYAPWMGVFSAQSKNAAALMQALMPGPPEKFQFIIALVGLGMSLSGVPLVTLTMEQFTALFVFSCFTLILCFLWALLLRKNNAAQFRLIFLYIAVPIGMMFLSSALVKGIVFQWHFGFLCPAAVLLVTFVLVCGKSWIPKVPIVLLCCVFFGTGLQAYYRAGFWNDDWKSVARHITENAGGEKLVISMLPLNDFPLKDYYLKGKGFKVESRFSKNGRMAAGLPPGMMAANAAFTQDCFWVVASEVTFTKEMDPVWLSVHFRIIHEKKFPTVFTQQPIRAEKLCLRKEEIPLRTMAQRDFIEMMSITWKGAGLDASFTRANYLFSKGYLGLAEKEMRNALAGNPGSPDVLVNLGFILREQGRPDEALAVWRKAEKKKPADRQISFLIAETSFVLGRTEEAKRRLKNLSADREFGKRAGILLDKIREGKKQR